MVLRSGGFLIHTYYPEEDTEKRSSEIGYRPCHTWHLDISVQSEHDYLRSKMDMTLLHLETLDVDERRKGGFTFSWSIPFVMAHVDTT